jgi:hypothetical protein
VLLSFLHFSSVISSVLCPPLSSIVFSVPFLVLTLYLTNDTTLRHMCLQTVGDGVFRRLEDAPIQAANKGFALLTKLGWVKGTGNTIVL